MYTIGFTSEKHPEKNYLYQFETYHGLDKSGLPQPVVDAINHFASRCEDKLSMAITMNGDTLLVTFE